MKQKKDSSKEFIILNALVFYTSRGFMVELHFYPHLCEYHFEVFVMRNENFPTYKYLADIANAHEVKVFEEGANDEFSVYKFIVGCAITDNEK